MIPVLKDRSVRSTTRSALGCIRIFILPHLLVGIGLIWALILMTLTALLGTDTLGRVTELSATRGSKGGTSYTVAFEFTHGLESYKGRNSIPPAQFQGLAKGMDIAVRYLPLLPNYSASAKPVGASVWQGTGRMLGFTLFWNGILSIFVWLAWVQPYRQKKLLEKGDSTDADVLEVQAVGSRSTHRRVKAAYTVNGIHYERQFWALREPSADLAAGDRITLYYDPRNPKRACSELFTAWEFF
jgi:hypothetical protein